MQRKVRKATKLALDTASIAGGSCADPRDAAPTAWLRVPGSKNFRGSRGVSMHFIEFLQELNLHF